MLFSPVRLGSSWISPGHNWLRRITTTTRTRTRTSRCDWSGGRGSGSDLMTAVGCKANYLKAINRNNSTVETTAARARRAIARTGRLEIGEAKPRRRSGDGSVFLSSSSSISSLSQSPSSSFSSFSGSRSGSGSGSCSIPFRISEEIVDAIENNRPVVALESAIITHGMPFPHNIDTALHLQTIIRQQDVIPATIGVIQGQLTVGLSDVEIETLGSLAASAGDGGGNRSQSARSKSPRVVKVSRRDLPFVLSQKLSGGTTVSGTIIAAVKAGIPIFVTGGLGGVHRGAETTFDISADLRELGRSPIAVVSAGIKSILDIGKTLEYLETEGVCVCVLKKDGEEMRGKSGGDGEKKKMKKAEAQEEEEENISKRMTNISRIKFPSFFTAESSFPAPYQLDNETDAAKLVHSSLQFGLESGILIAVPIPKEFAASGERIEAAIAKALEKAKSLGVLGKDMTPFLLGEINELTGGESLESNKRLIENNVRVGSEIAKQLARLRGNNNNNDNSHKPSSGQDPNDSPSNNRSQHSRRGGGSVGGNESKRAHPHSSQSSLCSHHRDHHPRDDELLRAPTTTTTTMTTTMNIQSHEQSENLRNSSYSTAIRRFSSTTAAGTAAVGFGFGSGSGSKTGTGFNVHASQSIAIGSSSMEKLLLVETEKEAEEEGTEGKGKVQSDDLMGDKESNSNVKRKSGTSGSSIGIGIGTGSRIIMSMTDKDNRNDNDNGGGGRSSSSVTSVHSEEQTSDDSNNCDHHHLYPLSFHSHRHHHRCRPHHNDEFLTTDQGKYDYDHDHVFKCDEPNNLLMPQEECHRKISTTAFHHHHLLHHDHPMEETKKSKKCGEEVEEEHQQGPHLPSSTPGRPVVIGASNLDLILSVQEDEIVAAERIFAGNT